LEVKVTLRVDDELYRFFMENDVDLDRVMQLFMNQMNYYFRETMSIYSLMRQVPVGEVLRRMASEYDEDERKSKEKLREYHEKNRLRGALNSEAP